ncbi:MAG: SsrA-binding protein SmpB [Opitutales bacterium]|nr:SsrA-binding protein SmpB [Opitutales bacterium]
MKKKSDGSRVKEVRNARASRDFFVDDRMECGIVLKGTEVKSIRCGQAQIAEAFVRLQNNKATLYHAHIAEYAFGTDANHNPYRPRQLLMHKREFRKWEQEIQSGGKAIIPLRLYFKQGLVKIEIGLCRSKKQYDKRDDMKKAVELREAEQMVKRYS